MAVLNKRAIVTAIEMYGVTSIRLGSAPEPAPEPALDVLIKALFANNEQGFAYDPNDLTTLYQDAAGNIPVTAAGQPVGLMKDKSGRNNHAFQTVSASRPILQRNVTTGAYYLAFDGVDDSLQANNIDFTMTDKVSLFAGVRKLSTVSGMVIELSSSLSTNNGSFYLAALAGQAVSNHIIFASKGTIFAAAQNPNLPLPISVVVSCKGNIAADSTIIRANGTQFSSATDLGTGNYGNYPLYIGSRAGTSQPFTGHLYSLIGIARLTTNAETLALEKAIAKLTGVVLNV